MNIFEKRIKDLQYKRRATVGESKQILKDIKRENPPINSINIKRAIMALDDLVYFSDELYEIGIDLNNKGIEYYPHIKKPFLEKIKDLIHF